MAGLLQAAAQPKQQAPQRAPAELLAAAAAKVLHDKGGEYQKRIMADGKADLDEAANLAAELLFQAVQSTGIKDPKAISGAVILVSVVAVEFCIAIRGMPQDQKKSAVHAILPRIMLAYKQLMGSEGAEPAAQEQGEPAEEMQNGIA